MVDGEVQWRCSKCREWFPERGFKRRTRASNGLTSQCRNCIGDQRRKRRAAQLEKNPSLLSNTQTHTDQIQLECQLCTYIEAIRRQPDSPQRDTDIGTLQEALDVLHRYAGAAIPNRRWMKKFILELLQASPVPLSLSEIAEHCGKHGFLVSRRRLSVRLSGMKRNQETVNIHHGFWTTAARVEEDFSSYDGLLDWSSRGTRTRETPDGTTEYRCSHCKRYYDADDFPRNKSSRDGLGHYCKQCNTKLQRRWATRQKEHQNG